MPKMLINYPILEWILYIKWDRIDSMTRDKHLNKNYKMIIDI